MFPDWPPAARHAPHGELAWTVWTGDAQQLISVGPVEVDQEEGVLYFGGQIREGQLSGLEFVGALYFVDEETAVIDLAMQAGNTELAFGQVLGDVN